jgi:hypothetical protein
MRTPTAPGGTPETDDRSLQNLLLNRGANRLCRRLLLRRDPSHQHSDPNNAEMAD